MSVSSDHARIGPPGGPRHGSTSAVLVAVAIAWGLLVILASMTVPVVTLQDPPSTATAIAPPSSSSPGASAPVTPDDAGSGQKVQESPRVTVLSYDGAGGVAVAGVPATISLVVAGLLWVGSRGPRSVLVPIAAWTLATALLLAGIVGS